MLINQSWLQFHLDRISKKNLQFWSDFYETLLKWARFFYYLILLYHAHKVSTLAGFNFTCRDCIFFLHTDIKKKVSTESFWILSVNWLFFGEKVFFLGYIWKMLVGSWLISFLYKCIFRTCSIYIHTSSLWYILKSYLLENIK